MTVNVAKLTWLLAGKRRKGVTVNVATLNVTYTTEFNRE
jgi:hypothetical protein